MLFFDFGPLVNDYLLLLLPVAAGAVIAGMVAVWKHYQHDLTAIEQDYEARVSVANQRLILAFARTGLVFAQQIARRPDVTDYVGTLRQETETYINKQLAAHGIDSIDAAAIESAIAQAMRENGLHGI